ncbi:hypothetical protein CSA37_07080 [Candidatus Fermentibacteria bacterium]|nr:MAG: hypothetical protein CSA37_09975 [Candidatus Fermentibacteria bacterium]PIE52322.1 MAG: hypothetical protein CSA37_07080 [Candidatus Fermentibacteria bacterium]
MSDQARLFTAAVLMMAVLVVSWFLTGSNRGRTGVQTAVQQQEPVQELQEETQETPQEISIDSEQQTGQVQEVFDYSEKTVTVIIPGTNGENIVTAEITTTGAAVQSWQLGSYQAFPHTENSSPVEMAEENWLVAKNSTGEPLLFTYEGPDTVVAGETGTAVRFESAGGFREFVFRKNYYGFSVITEVGDMNTSVSSSAIPETETNAETRGYYTASWYTNGHKKRDSSKIEGLEPVGNVSWIASSNKYFTILLMPESTDRADGYIAPGEGGSPEVSIDDRNVRVYAGPKSYTLLRELGGSQQDMVDFGWPVIRWIARLIFLYIVKILSFADNWGVRIIILGITLKILLYPLTAKSYVSMQKMQKVQPALKKIQEKYAKDPKRQQEEMQKFYKESGVNPLGGCFPILLQMPIFFAMFRVLANSVELRGQGFLLWITDLSRPEILIPFGTKIMGLEGIGLLPILLGALMILQQKLTGTSAAGAMAQQQKTMMYFMPLMMTFLFMRFASGLILYYTVFNIATFVQQEYIKKRMSSDVHKAYGRTG